MLTILKAQIGYQNKIRILSRNNGNAEQKITELQTSLDLAKNEIKRLENSNKSLHDRLNNINKLNDHYNNETGSCGSSTYVSSNRVENTGNELMSLLLLFKNYGNLTRPRFVLDFERVASQYGLEGKRKILFFTSRIRVPNPMWDIGLSTDECVFEDYKEAFLDAYWSREAQKTLKKQFLDARIEYKGADDLQKWLRDWYNRIKSLTFGPMGTEEIVEVMIRKFPHTCQDLLQVVDHSDFSKFVERTVQVVRAEHFRESRTRYNHGFGNRDNHKQPHYDGNNRKNNKRYDDLLQDDN